MSSAVSSGRPCLSVRTGQSWSTMSLQGLCGRSLRQSLRGGVQLRRQPVCSGRYWGHALCLRAPRSAVSDADDASDGEEPVSLHAYGSAPPPGTGGHGSGCRGSTLCGFAGSSSPSTGLQSYCVLFIRRYECPPPSVVMETFH